MTTTEARRSLPALTALRFFAALHVVLYHALRPTLVDAADPARRFLAAGPTAVTLFFVLSGFVLTWAHGPRAAGDRVVPRAFFRARFARLAPVYGLALLLAVPIGALARARGIVEDPLGPLSLVLVATGTQAFIPAAALRWNPPAWSLSCELFFYALFPWLVHALHGGGRARALVVGVLAWLVGLLLPALYLVLDPDGLGRPGILDEGTWLHAVKFHPLARLPDFVVGIVAGRVFAEGVRLPPALGVVAAAGAALVAATGLVPEPVLHNGALAPVFALVIVALASTPGKGFAPLSLLGEASYALYLLHVPMFLWAMAILRQRELAPGVAVTVGLLTIPVSLLVHRFVERPLRARLRGPG